MFNGKIGMINGGGHLNGGGHINMNRGTDGKGKSPWKGGHVGGKIGSGMVGGHAGGC